MLNYAKSYIERGWAVFPLVPGGKIPATKNGFKDAIKSIENISQLFQLANCNIGIATGTISGLVVIDFDMKSGGMDTLELLNDKLPNTLTARTGGGGVHLYYQHPEGHSVRNRTGLFQGVDVRGDGGYVVGPPSKTDGAYTWVNIDIPIAPLPDWLLKQLIDSKPSLITSDKKSLPLIIRGELSKSTLDFLINGAPKGTWNHRLFKAAKDYQEQGLSKEEFIERATHITGSIDDTDLSTIESSFKQQPKYGPRLSNNQALKELILSCYLIGDVANIDHKVFINFERGKIYEIDHKNLLTELNKEERKDFYDSRSLKARFDYNPHDNKPLITDLETGIYIYNWYNPPDWKRENFFFNKEISKVANLPPIYDRFLNHLTNNHTESKEYILDWIANSLRTRNFTILTAIGEEGVGKGILAEILKAVHGKHNFSLCSDTIFKEKFNGKLQNKTLVYIDEVALEDNSSHDRVKAVVNDELEIERKGQDAITTKNHASFYITSNRLDSVRIGPEDRRYSIVQLTEKKLKDTELRHVINSEILNDANLSTLAQYLFYRPVTFDTLKPFRSRRFEEMLAAGLNLWEEWFIEEFLEKYKSGDLIDMGFVQEEIKEHAGFKAAPSRRKIEALRRRYPDKFSIILDGNSRSRRKIKVL